VSNVKGLFPMSTYHPTRTAYVVAVPAIALAALSALEAIRIYLSDNESNCGGGIGRLGPGFALFFTSALALLATLVALIVALVTALRGRRWVWAVGLVVVVALGALGVLESYSEVAHMLVGSALGFGCSQNYTAVAGSFIFLFVSLAAFACLLLTRRRA
jgi:hypothetical protein